MSKISLKYIIDNKELTNGLHAIYLRIIRNRKSKSIRMGIECKKEHFKNESLTKGHKNHMIENEFLSKKKSDALRIIREFELKDIEFTFEEFVKEFLGNKKKASAYNLKSFSDEIIEEYLKSGRIKTAMAYKDTIKSVIKFTGEIIPFDKIDHVFLEKYEVFLRENGGTNGGIGFKMRHFRAIINKARKRDVIPKDIYPFENYKVSKLKSSSRKIALNIDEFKNIKNFNVLKYPHLLDSYYFFMFSIYGQGMNFKDLMMLQWGNIENGRVSYIRSKTKAKINFEILPPAQDILDYYKSQNRNTKFVFPILLQEGFTPLQIENRRHKTISKYNRDLKEIANILGLDSKPTSYVARHSFATILKFLGTPIEKISEMMGHQNVLITEAYLKDFAKEELDLENKKLLDI